MARGHTQGQNRTGGAVRGRPRPRLPHPPYGATDGEQEGTEYQRRLTGVGPDRVGNSDAPTFLPAPVEGTTMIPAGRQSVRFELVPAARVERLERRAHLSAAVGAASAAISP